MGLITGFRIVVVEISKIFLHKESSGRILYCAILMINITVSEIIELSTTTVLKPTISPNPLAGLAGRTDADTPFSLSVAAT